MERIQDIWLKIKGLGEDFIADWGLIVIVFLVALASFGLGRLSALEDAQPPVAIVQAAIDSKPRAMAQGGLLVAARTGSAYYFPWCAGAAKINSANKVWFETEAAARKAGYVPAKNCKGLAPQ